MIANRTRLNDYLEGSKRLVVRLLANENHKIEIAGQKGMLSDPSNILKKGYSITTINGKLVKDITNLRQEETIKTSFYEGSILSKITEIIKKERNDD
jgi:exodeoxyribonuclease VII large subunit